MAIYELYSQRQKKLRGEVPDVYIYDEIPKPLRVQIRDLWLGTLGNTDVSRSQAEVNRLDGLYGEIVGILRYEHGLDNLADVQESNYRTTTFMGELVAFLMNEPDPEKVLDAIEVSFQVIARMTSSFHDRYIQSRNVPKVADEAIAERV